MLILSPKTSQVKAGDKVKLKIKEAIYLSTRLFYRAKRFFVKDVEHKFLFLLSPPYCGSTLLSQLISTSRSVSSNNNFGTREGQTLPNTRKILFDHDRRWDTALDYDWGYIKSVWFTYWDPSAKLWLEKSPPNILRAKSIAKEFTPAYFIVFYRNPYAHCESLVRRMKLDPVTAAKFAIECLRHQKSNIETLTNVLPLSYEELTGDTKNVLKKLTNFIPELERLNAEKIFSAHNLQSRPLKITNLNEQKLKLLTRKQIEEINVVFLAESRLLGYFGYSIWV